MISRARAAIALAALLAVALLPCTTHAAPALRVGSKRFTESYILAEIAAQTARAAGTEAVHAEGLGATAIAYQALVNGEIDLYPDYTGTLAETILHDTSPEALARLPGALAARQLGTTGPLGFQDTYALAVRRDFAASRAVRTISDLAALSSPFTVGVSHEFLGRADGWPGLAARYGLSPREVRAMDHGLAYAALLAGDVDAVDAYSTDAKIAKYDLAVLADDRRFFPPYEATFVYRQDAEARLPQAFRALGALRGAIDAPAMRAMNGQAELDGRTFADVARDFVRRQGARAGAADPLWRESPGSPPSSAAGFPVRLGRSIVRHGPRHVTLVAVALVFATVFGIALGIAATSSRALASIILGVTGVVQTIPSLALLCLTIPLLGIGVVPTLVALSVYALLPITRNTFTALTDIPAPLRESARALGLTPREVLVLVELPLASRSILAGIKTSAVLTVGTATVAAFIGAGGFGEPISVGLNLNDTPTILEGAIPAALLAILVQALFVGVDRLVVPEGLRISTARGPE